jgi:protocadherin Fat 1/2/3
VGTEVLKLQAKDMDKGYNGLLTFVICGGDEAHGAWDILNSGNIIMGGGSTDQASLVVAAPLDREEIASYVLNISVWDQGKPPKFTSKLLQIKVLGTFRVLDIPTYFHFVKGFVSPKSTSISME